MGRGWVLAQGIGFTFEEGEEALEGFVFGGIALLDAAEQSSDRFDIDIGEILFMKLRIIDHFRYESADSHLHIVLLSALLRNLRLLRELRMLNVHYLGFLGDLGPNGFGVWLQFDQIVILVCFKFGKSFLAFGNTQSELLSFSHLSILEVLNAGFLLDIQ